MNDRDAGTGPDGDAGRRWIGVRVRLRSGGRARPGDVLVVLLPDSDTGTVGRVVVSNPGRIH